MIPWTIISALILRNLFYGVENWVLYIYDETNSRIKQQRKKPAQKSQEQQPLLNDDDEDDGDSIDETDIVDVTFSDTTFPKFTVQVVANEGEDSKESDKCHCSEQSLVGGSETQEWKVELDDSLLESDEFPSSDTTDGRSITSPNSVTDYQTILLSPQVRPSSSVTQYSLSRTDDVEVSYTFHLTPTKH